MIYDFKMVRLVPREHYSAGTDLNTTKLITFQSKILTLSNGTYRHLEMKPVFIRVFITSVDEALLHDKAAFR